MAPDPPSSETCAGKVWQLEFDLCGTHKSIRSALFCLALGSLFKGLALQKNKQLVEQVLETRNVEVSKRLDALCAVQLVVTHGDPQQNTGP